MSAGIETKTTEQATFAAGCFWGVEEEFRKLKGVVRTTVGYIGGSVENPVYEEVCAGRTGHAEAVSVEYNPGEISYRELLEAFWALHDPTQLNKQGPDTGTQYRSAIFYHTPEQKRLAEESKIALSHLQKYNSPIVTAIVSAGDFYKAEDYHQRYFAKRGDGAC